MEKDGFDFLSYWKRIYHEHGRSYECRAQNQEELKSWQKSARTILEDLIGLHRISSSSRNHRISVCTGEPELLGSYTRQMCGIETERDVYIPFWLLKPRKKGHLPLAIIPHGHDVNGMDSSVGIARDETEYKLLVDEDRDVGIQAVERDFVVIAPATRGLSSRVIIPDIRGRHGNQDCRSQLIHCLLVGRTPIGERVWDIQRLLDWAIDNLGINQKKILALGNSGGGMVSTYASAIDTRITITVASCSYSTFVSTDGYIHHCDCNTVPNISLLGEFHNVAGLICPRYLLTVNGEKDPYHSKTEINRAVNRLRHIYELSSSPDNYENRYGKEGHRYYKDIMWPFIMKALDSIDN